MSLNYSYFMNIIVHIWNVLDIHNYWIVHYIITYACIKFHWIVILKKKQQGICCIIIQYLLYFSYDTNWYFCKKALNIPFNTCTRCIILIWRYNKDIFKIDLFASVDILPLCVIYVLNKFIYLFLTFWTISWEKVSRDLLYLIHSEITWRQFVHSK